ncbi:MAG: NAD-dependent epimerase/dehydratase family protein [Proteobacteria bacterium]|nr:NAD-dependent epimerase/dehydratase family protein [Pseudomonadota bacterium]
MKILITGASGQIGTDLIRTLHRRGHTLVATDVREPEQLDDGVQWQELDVTERSHVSEVIAAAQPDAVFHLAAILSARGEANPQRTYEINQAGTYYVLESCREHGAGQVIFTSSIAAYGPGFGPGLPDPTPEEVALHPTTMYGVTKVGGELLCEYYHQRYGLDVRGVRFPGLISAELPGGGTSDYALFMYTEGIAKGYYEAFCRADTRIPLMYMPDGVRALIELCNAPRDQLSRCIYNLAAFSPDASEIADAVTRAVGDVTIEFAPDPVRQAILDSWPRTVDDHLARKEWGWKPTYDLESMTADLVPKIRELLAARS